MRILVIGSGGREHAVCSAFSLSPRVSKLFCASGNAGIAEIAECIAIKPDDISGLVKFAAKESIDLTFVGGETSLALGIVDEFEQRGLKIVGPCKNTARLEASKSFAKDFMRCHHIPTAAYKTAFSTTEAIEILEAGEFGGPESQVVVKADGLAAGKGVVVAKNRHDAIEAIGNLDTLAGSDAAEIIVLEECLVGREVSLLMFCDGENFALMPPTRDHKRVSEGDTGPNTGGMGTITDESLLNGKQTRTIIEEIIEPTLRGCRDEGFAFRGILFLGLMMTDNGAKVLEYNVRFGDPETQAILVRLQTDLVDICDAILSGTLDQIVIEWREGSSACVVLASKGYPEKPITGDAIHGLENVLEKISVFHAGTAKNGKGEFVTSGGRVLGVTAKAKNLQKALDRAYDAVKEISWDGMQYRRDIGK